ncbi:MAG: helix-turn-helix domain-containing protein [Kiritimatiellae bacterium]|nr:helix-turn-helix domain-containing protein [Kiritimatiellia bacterium]
MLGRVPGLARGLEVLEYLAQYPQGKTQKDIAAAMRLPAASASHITLRLEAAGYL